MLNNEEYKALIDSYLTGNLSPAEAATLEKGMSENPLLKNEVSLQKSIVEAVYESRKAELKARLNNIEVHKGQSRAWMKYAAALTLFVLVGGGSYYLTGDQEKEPVVVTNLQEIEKGASAISSNSYSHAKEEEQVPESISNDNKIGRSQESLRDDIQSHVKAKETHASKSNETVPHLPDMHTPEASLHEPLNKEMVMPEHGMGKSSSPTHSSVAGVEVIKNKKHKFHYRYFDNKLFLYGDFEAQTYEILELNNSEGQELYLKFENKYYDLEPNKTEISKLELVKNSKTLKQLEEIQGK